MSDKHRSDRLNVYTYSGRGQPCSGQAKSDAFVTPARAFLTEVISIVKNRVEKSGGHFEVLKAA
jgi:hypothetical protein